MSDKFLPTADGLAIFGSTLPPDAPAALALDTESIAALLAKITPGPWQACGCGKCAIVWSKPADCMVATGLGARNNDYTLGESVSDEQRQVNASFIAAAPEVVEWLLAHVAALTAARDEAEQRAGRLSELIARDHIEGAFSSCDECGTSFGNLKAKACPVCALRAAEQREATLREALEKLTTAVSMEHTDGLPVPKSIIVKAALRIARSALGGTPEGTP